MTQQDRSPLLGNIALQYITNEYPPKKRVVVAAANRLSTGVILVGARHWDNLMTAQLKAMGGKECHEGNADQGFIDQFGQYLSRDEARYVVDTNEQPLVGDDWGELYSENLY